jgi:hypothetical protein
MCQPTAWLRHQMGPPTCSTAQPRQVRPTVAAKLGDVFYDGVAARADPMIDQGKRETSYEE